MSRDRHTDFFEQSKKRLSRSSVKRAERAALKSILQLKLGELRRKIGIRQTDVKGFSQSAVSRLEGRKDLRLKTLVAYLASLGLTVEITARAKKGRKGEEYLLLRA